MRYRRADVTGGSYFFTVNLAEREKRLLIEHIDLLRAATRRVMSRHVFRIDAIVILPDHMHAIWTLPEGDADFATRWMLIKACFSRGLPKGERVNASREKKRERGIWQRRYWEHLIRNEEDMARHVDYIHHNPVKHGYVDRAADWKYSSIHAHIRAGKLTASWGAEEGEYGE